MSFFSSEQINRLNPINHLKLKNGEETHIKGTAQQRGYGKDRLKDNDSYGQNMKQSHRVVLRS